VCESIRVFLSVCLCVCVCVCVHESVRQIPVVVPPQLSPAVAPQLVGCVGSAGRERRAKVPKALPGAAFQPGRSPV